ncbi:hypothetical protein DRP04_12545 [Archaeoglobales archaeon]|nr:MAG: hypothetical protein DRP04_12545 [Archaeoglobales archaeon]
MVKIGQNMSKGKIWKKEVIDALRLSSCSKKELIELVMAKDPKLARIKVKEPKRAYEAARKRIERFLDDLISLGLVEEKGGGITGTCTRTSLRIVKTISPNSNIHGFSFQL